MSVDPRGRRRRWPLFAVALVAVAAALAAWILVPRSLGDIRVEDARAVPGGVAVTFATPVDLRAMLADSGMAYVAARLASCREQDLHALEVAVQNGGALIDRRRVRPLPAGTDGRPRYRVVFDNSLSRLVDHVSEVHPALTAPGGLCFSLYAARMWFGVARSNTVPLTLAGSGPARATP